MATADGKSKGYEIGSTYIDGGFQLLAKSLLEPLAPHLGRPTDDVAWELRNTVEFQDAKHGFKHETLVDSPDTEIPVPRLEGSSIALSRSVVKKTKTSVVNY